MRRFVRDQTVSPDWKCPLYRGVPKERFRCSKTNLNQGILNGTGLIFWNFEVPGVQIRRMITNVWVISEKISCRLISSEREILQRNGFVCHGKKNISPEVWEKTNYYTNQTAHTYPPATKVKWSALIYAAMKYVTSFHGDTGPPASESAEARLCCHIG